MTNEEQRDVLAGLAAEAAGTALDRRHRTMLLEVMVAALIVGLLIVLPITLALNANASDISRQNAASNCRLIGRLAHIEAGFISSDAKDRQGALTRSQQAQVQAGFAKIFDPKFIRAATRRQQRLDGYTIDYWQGPERQFGPFANQEPLLAQTRDLARVNCRTRVK